MTDFNNLQLKIELKKEQLSKNVNSDDLGLNIESMAGKFFKMRSI